MTSIQESIKRLNDLNVQLEGVQPDVKPVTIQECASFTTTKASTFSAAEVLKINDGDPKPIAFSDWVEEKSLQDKDNPYAEDEIKGKKWLEFPNDPQRLSQIKLNQEAMFITLNAGDRTDNGHNHWQMFHDGWQDQNNGGAIMGPLKLFAELSVTSGERNFRNCYITDVIKNDFDGVSDNIKDKYHLGKTTESIDKLEEPMRTHFLRCVAVLAQECAAIQPKRLIAVGGDAHDALKKIAKHFAKHPSDDHNIQQLVSLINSGSFTKIDHYTNHETIRNLIASAQEAL